MNFDDYLPLFHAATTTGMSVAELERWIARGDLPAVRDPDGRLYVFKGDLPLIFQPARTGGDS